MYWNPINCLGRCFLYCLGHELNHTLWLSTEILARYQETDAHDPQPDGHLKTMQKRQIRMDPSEPHSTEYYSNQGKFSDINHL